MIGHLLPPVIMGALATALPDKTQAAPGSPSNNVQIANLRGDRRYAVNAFLGAGQGGGCHRDGAHAVSFPSNLSNTPVEVMETQAPIRVLHRSIVRGSGGRGLYRGGDGLSFAFRFQGESPAIASFMVNRVNFPAPGLAGGEAGKSAAFEINGQKVASSGQHILKSGDHVAIRTGGGGGFGPATS